MRVIIPEPSLWDPETPFLYEGPVELWEDGQRCDQVQVRHGLRKLNLGPRGLRCNGRMLSIQGVARSQCSEEEARRLHKAGYNTLLAPALEEASSLWDIGDKLGFLVLGRLTQMDNSIPLWLLDLEKHPCFLGWLMSDELLTSLPQLREVYLWFFPRFLSFEVEWPFFGVELQQQVPRGPLEEIAFMACKEELLPEVGQGNLPKIVLRESELTGSSQPAWASSPGILGWIDLSL
jgi:hypothetical protein